MKREAGAMASPTPTLDDLAKSNGVQTSYYDDRGKHITASADALLAVLRALGAPLERPADAGDALRARKQDVWRRVVEPVHVAPDGRTGDLPLRLPAALSAATLDCHLLLENGEMKEWTAPAATLPVTEAAEVSGINYRIHRMPVPAVPVGYHWLTVRAGTTEGKCLLLAAPTRAWGPVEPLKTWGGFLPLYAVRSERDWGAGDFADLDNLTRYVQGLGGGLVGTLPLLAAFLEEPFEPSPYSPASRLFWNEFYLAVDRIPELERCPAARQFLASDNFRCERDALRATRFVDYPRVMALKRRVLSELAKAFFQEPGGRQAAFRQYLAANPRAEDYAAFRAAVERHRKSWWNWPRPAREGTLKPADSDEAARRYHLYVQWQADEQLRGLSEGARADGPGLYLDLPLGVNPDSYDLWRERTSFATGISAGAPPDVFFTKGQDWGFPPLHPENVRADGYRYLRDFLHHHMKYSGVLRIDHLMGLHRLYWVPEQLGPRQGVYVRYPAEELYAIYSLESNRHRTVLVGEDLGTVPDYVRPAMATHNVHRLYVAQYEAQPEPDRAFPQPPAGAIASLNTHDMPTFTAFWTGADIQDRREMGLLDDEAVRREGGRRAAIRANMIRRLRESGWLGRDEDYQAVLRASLQYMANSDAQVVLANLEDLWAATEPQNRPGTWQEKPNWRLKAVPLLEQFDKLPGFRTTLQALDRATRRRA
jgi:4-alpha-glucanotransferase